MVPHLPNDRNNPELESVKPTRPPPLLPPTWNVPWGLFWQPRKEISLKILSSMKGILNILLKFPWFLTQTSHRATSAKHVTSSERSAPRPALPCSLHRARPCDKESSEVNSIERDWFLFRMTNFQFDFDSNQQRTTRFSVVKYSTEYFNWLHIKITEINGWL